MNMNLKNKWQDITLGMYQELISIQSESAVDLSVQRLAILCDTDSQIIRDMQLGDFYDLLEEIRFLNSPIDVEWKKTFEFKGQKYGFIPDLNFITTGEWMDADAWKEDSNSNLHYYAAMLWRPITGEWSDGYTIEDHTSSRFTSRAELFKELPITYIQGGLVFFLTFNTSYISSIISSPQLNSEVQTTPKKKKVQKATKKSKKESS
jgi:hypothetical protein